MIQKIRRLSDYSLINNSGLDLWDYLFEGQRLKKFEESEDLSWYDDGIDWLTTQLLPGELFKIYEENPVYAYTNLGRVSNIKRKTFKKITKQSSTFQVNFSGGAVSLTKMIKHGFGIILTLDNMPDEVKSLVNIPDRTKRNYGGSVGRPKKYETWANNKANKANNEQETRTDKR